MDLGNGYQIGLVLGIKVVEIRCMLEVVGVQFLAFKGQVGLYIIGEFLDLQLIALFLQNLFGHSQNLGMGCGRSTNNNLFVTLLGVGAAAGK